MVINDKKYGENKEKKISCSNLNNSVAYIMLFVYSLQKMVPLYTCAVNIQVNGDSFYLRP